MANTQERKFRAEEELVWLTVEGQTHTRRMVSFEKYVPGGSAVVQFSHNAEGLPRRYTVPLRELSRVEAPSNVPLYHQAPITPYRPPQPPTEAQLAERLSQRRTALAEAHEDVRRCRDVTRSTGELVTRASQEFEASRAALLGLEAKIRGENTKLERALRAGETPPEMQPAQDRAAIVQRVQATEAALHKFQAEDREAQARLGAAVAGIRHAAVAVITALLEQEIERLRQGEEAMLEFRAGLQKITAWAGASGTALRLSEAASAVLVNPVDRDRAKFLGSAAVPPWERLLEELLVDPNAEFGQIEDSAEAA